MKTRRRGITARQSEVLATVRELATAEGPPSASKVAERLAITRMCAVRHIRALERKGYLLDVPKLVSSGQWALTEQAEAFLADAEPPR